MKRRHFTHRITFALLAGFLFAANASAQNTPPSVLTSSQAHAAL